MAAGAAGVDACVLGPHLHLHLIGFADYLLVWGTMHQWGFACHDGTLTRSRWRPWALAAAGRRGPGRPYRAGAVPGRHDRRG
jgi:hypothetical protein